MTALDLIESVRDYTVLFVGDTIIDEYRYVSALQKSPKEHLIPVRYESGEVFHGGVEAAAAHAQSFCKRVEIDNSGPVTRKVRYVDGDMRKLFEVQHTLASIEPKPCVVADVLVVADFGHGAISEQRARHLSYHSFVAVNAQTNSANYGYNLITKYPRADYICIDEPEARLAARMRSEPIEEVIRYIADACCCETIVVTLGKNGAIGYQRGAFVSRPARSDRVRDTMGAGDAFFAVTAPMAKTGHISDLLTIGNAAGALKTAIVGHRRSITKNELIKFLHDTQPIYQAG